MSKIAILALVLLLCGCEQKDYMHSTEDDKKGKAAYIIDKADGTTETIAAHYMLVGKGDGELILISRGGSDRKYYRRRRMEVM